MAELRGRTDLEAWRANRPTNYYDAARHLHRLLLVFGGRDEAVRLAPGLRAFGDAVVAVIEPAVEETERHRDLPRHDPYDGVGRRVERIVVHPDRDRAAAAAWASGLAAIDDVGPLEQSALFYLLSHVGEGGLACPLVCTTGLARAIRRHGPDELRRDYLGGLTQRSWPALRGSQFLTEIQGGSDVGANEVVARPLGDGSYALRGEKWFCSVADAELFAVTARPEGAPEGTRGLGCFLVPRLLDDGPNGFRIRRLKDKLGTRGLASAEIDFEDAVGWPIGAVTDGFKIAVGELLNTSRWLNAVGSCGLMRRAYLEASSFATHRVAFGAPIASRPLVREQLAVMKALEHAGLASTLALSTLVAALDERAPDPLAVAAHRFVVNANKFVTSIDGTEVVHRGIEVLGGNGTIESFSALPRLYRDAVVYESWEGAHNVLCAQVQRDERRFGLADAVVTWSRDLAARSVHEQAEVAHVGVLDAVATLRQFLQGDEDLGRFRVALVRVMRALQSCALWVAALDEESVAVATVFDALIRDGVEVTADEVDRALGPDVADR